MVRALSDAGAPLLVGSDSPQFFMVPGFSAHREMEALENAGLVLHGKWLSRADLDKLLEDVASAAAAQG